MAKPLAPAKRHKHGYSSDRPISLEKEDLLGRADFARRLADDIRAWGGHDSLVIALYGGWGCGKTSVKNLIHSHLSKGRTPIPVMEFNPWQFSGRGNITSAFFGDLKIALHDPAQEAGNQTRADQLQRYAARLTSGGPAPVNDPFNSGAGEPAIARLKHDAAESLATLDRPVLVVIDDIDRLTVQEIREVLQLVKANADFPNLIYLLLCERGIVSGALNEISGNRGGEFLEKIVQVGYDVPHPSREAIQKILFHRLDEILKLPGVELRWEEERWRHLYRQGLAGYFQNLRHVYRFLASFSFNVRSFQRDGMFEVNPVDLIAIEALRVFDPAVYERLPGSKHLFARDSGRRPFGAIKQEIVDTAVAQVLSNIPQARQDAVREILQILFPAITETYAEKDAIANHKQAWLREARVCHPDLFDKYFTFLVADNDLSQTELDKLVGLANDRAGFVRECEALERRGLLKTAFERLDAFRNELPLSVMPSLISALSDISDSFPAHEGGVYPLDPLIIAWRLIYFGLRREKDASKRFRVLRGALLDSGGLLLAVQIVALEERTEQRVAAGPEFLVGETDHRILKELSIARIRDAARTGVLRSHPRAMEIVGRWRAWVSPTEIRRWIAAQCADPEGAAWLLSIVMGKVGSNGETRYYVRLADLEEYAEVDMVSERISHFDEEKLPGLQRVAVGEFRRALRRRNEGKPESDGRTRFDEED